MQSGSSYDMSGYTDTVRRWVAPAAWLAGGLREYRPSRECENPPNLKNNPNADANDFTLARV